MNITDPTALVECVVEPESGQTIPDKHNYLQERTKQIPKIKDPKWAGLSVLPNKTGFSITPSVANCMNSSLMSSLVKSLGFFKGNDSK